MRVAAIQMVSGLQVQVNLERAALLIERAAKAGAQLICLPEYFCILGQHGYDKVQIAEPFEQGPMQFFLSQQAKQHSVTLIGGSVPLVSNISGKVFNSCLVFNPDGQRIARYDKIHLFTLNQGAEQFDESLTIVPGTQPVQFSLKDGQQSWRIGLSICYDLRFAELFRAVSPFGARCDIIFVPSAFTHTTGQDHWEVLLRARAIENQCYIVAPAQGGVHENGRRTWGHSLIADPWGTVLNCHREGEGVVLADLSLSTLAQTRSRLPSLLHQTIK
jgi:deaminated glutathione amidase